MTAEAMEFLIQTGALGLLALVFILGMIPAMKNIGKLQITIQRLVDQNEKYIELQRERNARDEQLLRDIIHILGKNREDTRLLRMAIRVAFYGRSNGHTWEEAKRHYEAASQLLADQDADEMLKQVEKDIESETYS